MGAGCEKDQGMMRGLELSVISLSSNVGEETQAEDFQSPGANDLIKCACVMKLS